MCGDKKKATQRNTLERFVLYFMVFLTVKKDTQHNLAIRHLSVKVCATNIEESGSALGDIYPADKALKVTQVL